MHKGRPKYFLDSKIMVEFFHFYFSFLARCVPGATVTSSVGL